MMSAITGKNVAVVGASRGIGAEFVRQLAAKGNKVIAGCRNPEAVKEKLESMGDVIVNQVDISDSNSISDWANSVAEVVPHLDLVINNAGIYGPRTGLEDVTAEDMINVFRTNAVGPLIVVQQLKKRGLIAGPSKKASLIANITSKVGSVEDNGSGSRYGYRSSKAALNIINKSLSIDLANEGITATLLHPGWVLTDMGGQNALTTVEDSVAGMIAVLESDKDLQGTWHDFRGNVIPW